MTSGSRTSRSSRWSSRGGVVEWRGGGVIHFFTQPPHHPTTPPLHSPRPRARLFPRQRLSGLRDPLVADDAQLEPVFLLEVARACVVDAHEVGEEFDGVLHDRAPL